MFKGVNNKLSISDHLELLCMVCMGEKHEQMLGDIACNCNRGLVSAVHITGIKFCRLGVWTGRGVFSASFGKYVQGQGLWPFCFSLCCSGYTKNNITSNFCGIPPWVQHVTGSHSWGFGVSRLISVILSEENQKKARKLLQLKKKTLGQARCKCQRLPGKRELRRKRGSHALWS